MIFAIVDYGASNMFSLISALKRLGVETEIVVEDRPLKHCSGIVLPGVGNFSSASASTNRLRDLILDAVDKGTPLLGICLGLQLLFEQSEEGKGEGLGILKGKVVRFPCNLKVPHMGWNLVIPSKDSRLLAGIQEKMWVYFAHSFYPEPLDDSIKKGTTTYGIDFTSVVERENVFGTQFHPEKSGVVGRAILANFAKEARR
ncbi:MAG: imidazole glycerol phosphate synthase subunit HisH [Nitrososphaeria archaeon]